MTLPERRRRGPVSARTRARFLEALAGGAKVEEAAAAVGRSKQTLYRLRDSDSAFAEGWRQALWAAAEPIEDVLEAAAVHGWDEEEYNGAGELVRRHHRWSPQPAVALLRFRKPEYRESAPIAIAISGDQVRRELEEVNAAHQKMVADPAWFRDAMRAWKTQLLVADAQGELTDEQARQASLLRRLEEVGVIDESGLPAHLALNPGPSANGDETREA